MPADDIKLGRLSRIELREVWSSEASDFTPWLAHEGNLALLGEAVGLDLELVAEEKNVGLFRADILCRDLTTEDWVLIENQLARTDHTHLGQLITYAAGLQAVTVIWIANRFTEEHRAALDWLNSMTDTGLNFFGVEVELWRIGESATAPKFNIVSKPNDWARTVSGTVRRGGLTDTKQTQLAFWTAFREYATECDTQIKPTKPSPSRRMSMEFGRSGISLSAIASFYDSEAGSFGSHEIRAEVILWDENAKFYFPHLEGERQAIVSELGCEPEWVTTPDTQRCRISIRRPVADLNDRSSWPELHEWLLAHLQDLDRVVGPRVRGLPSP